LIARGCLESETYSSVNAHCYEPSGDAADVDPDIPILQKAVHLFSLSDIVIRPPFDCDDVLPDDAQLFLVSGNKVQKMKAFADEHIPLCWRADESLQV
jgi:hypothetical protein